MKVVGFIFLGLAAICVAIIGLLTLNQRALLYHPNAEEVAPNFPGVTALRLDTEDGERIVAWWLPPPDGGPVFLFFDGNGGRPEIWQGRWQRITEGGAGFLAVYYRGYSGSTGRPTEAGLHADARAGYDWLLAQGFAPRDIVIHGVPLGSGVAVQLAAARPARALILEAPFSSMSDEVAHVAPFVPRFLLWDRYLSRDYVGRVNMPVLIAHGDADTVIPFAQGQELYAWANDPKMFVRMPGSDHATLTRDGLYDHIWPFLAQHPAE